MERRLICSTGGNPSFSNVQLKETEQRSLGKLCIVAQRGFRPSIIHPELVRRLVADVLASHMSRVAEVKTTLVGAFVCCG